MTLASNFYNLKSRIHPLNMFGPGFYLKRDDELSGSISGTKVRKYSSLIPYLVDCGAKRVAVIGSTQSNNVLGLCQALIEQGISPHLYLLESHSKQCEGNFALIRLFGCDTTLIPRSKWKQVTQIARQEFEWVIPEGADHPASDRGSGTLVDDILRNEEEIGTQFDRIFLDAGTGSTARGVLKRLEELGVCREVHVIALADLQISIECTVHKSVIAPSFGSINRSVKDWVERVARQEGVIVDPLYSAKLFATVDALHRAKPFEGKSLIVHSGLSASISWTVSREWGRHACANSRVHSHSLTARPS